MDFHLLEGYNRSTIAQQLKYTFVGTDARGSSAHDPFAGAGPKELHAASILSKVARRKNTPKYQHVAARKILVILFRLPRKPGQGEIAEFNETHAEKLLAFIHRKEYDKSITKREGQKDLTSISLGAPSLERMNDPASITALNLNHRDMEKDNATTLLSTEPKTAHIALDSPHSGAIISQVMSKTKPRGLQDPLIVWSGEPDHKPYYILLKMHKDAAVHGPVKKDIYELTIPFEYFHKRRISSSHLGVTEEAKFKELWGQDPNSLAVLHTETTDKPFKEVVEKMQRLAWSKGKLYLTHREAFFEINKRVKILKKKRKKTDKENHAFDVLKSNRQVYKALLKGEAPAQKYIQGATEGSAAVVSGWSRVAWGMKESISWYIWLLAAEEEYGVRVPERQGMRSLSSTTPAHLKLKDTNFSIRQKREYISTGGSWNKYLLGSLGFPGNASVAKERLKSELARVDYKFSKSDAEIKRLWVILPLSYIKQKKIPILPADISDYVDHSVKNPHYGSGKITLLGRVNGQLKHRTNREQSFTGHIFRHGSPQLEYMLVHAGAWLKMFDSPIHGGERLQHTHTGPKITRRNPVWISSREKPKDNSRAFGPKNTQATRSMVFTPPETAAKLEKMLLLNKTLDAIENKLGLKFVKPKFKISKRKEGYKPKRKIWTTADANRHSMRKVNHFISLNKALDQAEKGVGIHQDDYTDSSGSMASRIKEQTPGPKHLAMAHKIPMRKIIPAPKLSKIEQEKITKKKIRDHLLKGKRVAKEWSKAKGRNMSIKPSKEDEKFSKHRDLWRKHDEDNK